MGGAPGVAQAQQLRCDAPQERRRRRALQMDSGREGALAETQRSMSA